MLTRALLRSIVTGNSRPGGRLGLGLSIDCKNKAGSKGRCRRPESCIEASIDSIGMVPSRPSVTRFRRRRFRGRIKQKRCRSETDWQGRSSSSRRSAEVLEIPSFCNIRLSLCLDLPSFIEKLFGHALALCQFVVADETPDSGESAVAERTFEVLGLGVEL